MQKRKCWRLSGILEKASSFSEVSFIQLKTKIVKKANGIYLRHILLISLLKCITGVYKLNIPQTKLWYNLSIMVHKQYMNDQPPSQDQMLPTKPDINKTILVDRKDKDLQCSYTVLIMPCQSKKILVIT